MTFWLSYSVPSSLFRPSCYWLPSSHLSLSTRYATTISGTDYLDPSTAAKHHPYPFPKHPRPTPYEIFHLPTGASSAEIKSRYYDLVRYHHPDSSHARLYTPCPNERNNRFQTILSAYDFLQNPSATGATRGHFGHGSGFDPYMAEINRRRRTSQNAEYMKQRRQAMDAKEREREQEKWNRTAGGPRERVMIALGVFALLGGLYPSFFLFPFRLEKTHRDAASNLTRARNDAQEIGHLRREELRKRVRDIKAAKEVEQRSLED